MDLGKPLVEYGPVDAASVRARMLALPDAFWDIDTATRTALARGRPGRAVYFYNDMPAFLRKAVTFIENNGAHVHVLRYPDRPLYGEIQAFIDAAIRPHFPDCDIMKVQLAELPPGQVIEEHRDAGVLALIHRLHVPLVTDPKVRFTIAGGDYFLARDILYDLNNVVMHAVVNASEVMRVHLLVDMLPRKLGRARYHDSAAEMHAACLAMAGAEAMR